MPDYKLDNFIKNGTAIAAMLYRLTRKYTKFNFVKEWQAAFRNIQESISSEKTMAFFGPSNP